MANNTGLEVNIKIQDEFTKTFKQFEEALKRARASVHEFSNTTKDSAKNMRDYSNSLKNNEYQIDKEIKKTEFLSQKRRQLNKDTKELENSNKKLTKQNEVMGAIAGRIGGGLVSIMSVGKIKSIALEWDKVMTKIKAITHSSDSDMQALSMTLKNISGKYGKDVIDLAHEALNLSSAMPNPADMLKHLPSLVTASIAANASLKDTAAAYIPFFTAYKDLDPSKISNLVAYFGDFANQKMPEVGMGISDAVTAFSLVNQDARVLAATYAQLGQSGFTGSRAGTAVRNFANVLSNVKNAKLLQPIGIKFEDVNITKTSFTDILEKFKKAKEQMEKKAGGADIYRAAIQNIFGQFSFQFESLISNFDNYNKLLQKTNFFNAEKTASEQMKGLSATVSKLGQLFQNQLVNFGENISTPLIFIGNSILYIADKLKLGGDLMYKYFGDGGKLVYTAISDFIIGGGMGAVIGGGIGALFGGGVPGAMVGAKIGGAIGGLMNSGGSVSKELTRQNTTTIDTNTLNKLSNLYQNQVNSIYSDNNISRTRENLSNFKMNFAKELINSETWIEQPKQTKLFGSQIQPMNNQLITPLENLDALRLQLRESNPFSASFNIVIDNKTGNEVSVPKIIPIYESPKFKVNTNIKQIKGR